MDEMTRQALAAALMQAQARTGPMVIDPQTRQALKELQDPNPERFKSPGPLFPKGAPVPPPGIQNAPNAGGRPDMPVAPAPPVPWYGF